MEIGSVNNGQLLALGAAVLLLAVFSRRALGNPQCHGFYRFFAFVAIASLIVVNAAYWYTDIFSIPQLLSWLLLAFSIVFVVWGLHLLRTRGGHRDTQSSAENFDFENTSELVTTGLYHYIRHPMYSSLMLLSWGALIKHVSVLSLILAVVATLLLLCAAWLEERENTAYFGRAYSEYMKSSKRFFPGIF